MSPTTRRIRTWTRRRSLGRVRLFTRRDDASVACIGLTVIVRARQVGTVAQARVSLRPLFVARWDRFDDDHLVTLSVGRHILHAGTSGLADGFDVEPRKIGPFLVSVTSR